MTDEGRTTGLDGEDPGDLGAPVEALRDLALDVGGEFGPRVRRRIERRVLGSDLVELAWTAPLTVVLELLRAPFEWFQRGPKS
ncbi:MAG: hypothetical protein OEW19_12625 [Acidobacteriota bacterium]|nr:hypothetical protein [Acidobacteriota bacterium]